MKSTLSIPAIDEEKFLLQDLQLTICLSIECSTFFSLQARHFYMMVSIPYQQHYTKRNQDDTKNEARITTCNKILFMRTEIEIH